MYMLSIPWYSQFLFFFQTDVDVPLLGEIVSSGPKGVLIKEAKVKKPSTVPLVNPEEPRQVCSTLLSKIPCASD
jgi:hypothetical protein